MLTVALVVTALYHLLLGVPYVPTPRHITDAMISLIPWKGNEQVIDLGAGDGRVLEAIKHRYPQVKASGCEVVPTIWLLAIVRAFVRRSGVRLALRSMFKEDLSQADVVVLYLFPTLMKRLEEKFDHELKPGAYVVTHTFGFPNRTPLRTVRLPRLGGEVSVFLYQWNLSQP